MKFVAGHNHRNINTLKQIICIKKQPHMAIRADMDLWVNMLN